MSARATPNESLTWRRLLGYWALIGALLYAVADMAVTVFFFLRPPLPSSYAVFENSGRTLRFDAIRGVFLGAPARFARISQHKVEFQGIFQGNSVGLPDEDDFGARRDSSGAKRIAVFGDSFSAAQYLEVNWPSRAEELIRARGGAIELLNFSIDGGGLANWWSMLSRIVKAENYELDGVVFAVRGNDLGRRFIFYEHGQSRFHQFAVTSRWDPSTWPATLAQARPLLVKNPNAHIITSADFDRALAGKWRPQGSLRPVLTVRAIRVMRAVAKRLAASQAAASASSVPTDSARRRLAERSLLIDDIRQYLAETRLPVLVVWVPGKDQVLQPSNEPLDADVHAFARTIGARLIDGRQAFAGANREELVGGWFPMDGHWAQGGSDRFARFVAPLLADWPRVVATGPN